MYDRILNTGIIYRNPKPHVSSKHAYFPSVILMNNGEMLASFVIGEAFEAVNMNTYISRSKDMGNTWTIPKSLIFRQPNSLTSNSSRITVFPDGKVAAILVNSHRKDHPQDGLANPENLGFVPTDIQLIRSEDFGNSWLVPETISPPLNGPSFELCSPIIPLKDGRWIWPTSTWRNWEGYAPNGMKMIALVSDDSGKTWPEYIDVMDGNEESVIYWESKIIELRTGLLIAVAWAYDELKGIDLPNQYTISHDGGRTWLDPCSTGIQGQTLAIAELSDSRLLCVYRRMDKPGLWATISVMDNNVWINENHFPIWGSHTNGFNSDNQNMVHQFNELKFGAPCITLLPDNEIFITFWCYENLVSNIRWVKIEI